MSNPDRFAPLIPWYVNGTLDEVERGAVEAHLTECASCRRLLYQARGQQELAVAGPLDAHLEHVRPELLVHYAERPDTLEPETRKWVERRVAACADCREALERLREVDTSLTATSADVAVAATAERGGPLRGLWQALAASVLRPAPALAYLLMLLALPLAWIGLGPRDAARGEAVAAPHRIVTGSERSERSALGEPATPLAVPLPPGDEPVLLELRTDLRGDDIRDLRFLLEITREGETLWSEPRAPSDFTVDDDGASLAVLLRPRRLGRDRFEVRLRVVKPGDPLDGQALFRRTFVVGG